MNKPSITDPWIAEAVFNDSYLCFHLDAPITLSISEIKLIINSLQNTFSLCSVCISEETVRFTKYTDGKYLGTWYVVIPIFTDIKNSILNNFKCIEDQGVFRIIDKINIQHD